MKFKVIILVLMAFVLNACGQNGVAPRQGDHTNLYVANGNGIIGGVLVESTDPISARTALLIDIYRGSICSASILNASWLLTAAHCVVGVEPASLLVAYTGSLQDVVAGKYREDLRGVAEIHVHPIFIDTVNKINELAQKAKEEGRELTNEEIDAITDWGDIALIRINGTMPSTKTPVALMDSSKSLYKGQSVVLAGYGRTGPDMNAPSGELRKVSVNIAEPVWGQSEVLVHNSGGTGACYGDSGGPAYLFANGEYFLFGVTSRGVGGTGCDKFAVYTSAITYSPWIKSIAGL